VDRRVSSGFGEDFKKSKNPMAFSSPLSVFYLLFHII